MVLNNIFWYSPKFFSNQNTIFGFLVLFSVFMFFIVHDIIHNISHPKTTQCPIIEIYSNKDSSCKKLQFYGNPDIKRLTINIGSNSDPLIPDENDETHAVLAFEPDPRIVASIMQRNIPRLFMVATAISNFSGITQFTLFNTNGVSSSLSAKALIGGQWTKEGITITVPVIALKTILECLPSNIICDHIMTDMQGYDLHSLKSAGRELRRCKTIKAETWVERSQSSYDVPTPNDINEYKEYMPTVGFKFVQYVQDYNEGDSYWVRDGE